MPAVPMPDLPLGSAFLGRVKWRSIQSMITAYRGAIQEAAETKRALGDMKAAELEFGRAVRLLDDAETVHVHDEAIRAQARNNAIDAAEESELNLEENRASRATRRAKLRGESIADETPKANTGSQASNEAEAAFQAMKQASAWRQEAAAEIAKSLAGRREEDASPAEKKLFAELRRGVEQMIQDYGLE